MCSKPPTPPSNSALQMEKNMQYESDAAGGRNLQAELRKLLANPAYLKLLAGFAIALVRERSMHSYTLYTSCCC